MKFLDVKQILFLDGHSQNEFFQSFRENDY